MRTNLIKIIFTLGMMSPLVLSACTTSTTTPTEEAQSPTLPPPEPTTTEETKPTPTTAPSPTLEPTEAVQPFVLTDGLGRDITFQQPAQQIVSIAPSNTEILFAVGAGDQVVARDAFSDYPEEVQAVTDIGGGWGEIDTETIISLEPDLILAAEINAPEQVQSLEDLGLTVFYLGNPADLDGLYENLRVVAQISGHEDQVEDLIMGLKDRVSAVEGKISQVEGRPLVFYELDGTDSNAPWTSGPGTFIDMLISMAGGTNLGNVLDGAWAQISVEQLVAQDPDIVLLGDYIWGGVTPEDVAARPGWETIAAVQDGQVYPFDDNLVSRPGPRMVAGLEELAKLLHPELFP
jgi:iron complex transport system substrate-binding protein